MRRQRPSDKKKIPEWEEICATACAVHNMHLKATGLKARAYARTHRVAATTGLCIYHNYSQVGAYWSSWYELFRKSDECASFLGLSAPDGDRCLGVFVIGTTEKLDKIRGSRQPIESVVEWR